MFKSNGRVRKNTNENINQRIDQEISARVRFLSLGDKKDIDKRLNELNTEWDIEKTLEVNASVIALTGIITAAIFNKKWLILPGIVTAFLLQHGIQGWCPPLPVFRRMGIRTKAEIDKEKMTLKAIRGDFSNISPEDENLKRADKALKAVSDEK
jgi:hypothetical protein